MHRFLGGVTFTVAAVATMGVVAGPASGQQAEPPIIDIPVDTVVRGEPGTEHELATVPVDAADVGLECTVVADGTNNPSVHENTDLLVRSGDSEVTVPDVEREPGAVTEATDTIVLGPDVAVFVRLGPDEVFSGGTVVTVDCSESPTTTESTTTTTAPATTATTELATTTTMPATSETTLHNNPGPTLPNTGAGTDGLLVAAGLILLVGAGALVGSAKLRQRSHT